MRTIDQITYRARNGSTGIFYEAATSIQDQGAIISWWRRLEPWLLVGKAQSRAYLNFGSQAAYLRWYADPQSNLDWQYVLVLTGPATVLTGDYALELDDPDPRAMSQGDLQTTLARKEQGPGHHAMAARARGADAVDLLIPLLAHALRDERRVTMPWTEASLAEAVMWGLIRVLAMIGETRPVSYFTCMSAPSRDLDTPGLFVSFRRGATSMLPPDPGFRELAADLAHRFAADPSELGLTLTEHGMLEPLDHNGRINRLLTLRPILQEGTASTEGTRALNDNINADASKQGRHRTQIATGEVVMCPMCLHEIDNWNSLDSWHWDPNTGEYQEVTIPPHLNNRTQLDYHLYGTRVRCPAPQGDVRIDAHYLPADYGLFGPPIVLGFVGLSLSGKSHLLASMVGAIVSNELQQKYGILCTPLDNAWHRRFVETWVNPLLRHDQVLPGTREGVIEFADAFLMKARGGPERVVALFDVAGGDLTRLDETKRFLWIADGLFFVIDPDHMSGQWAEDETFSNVLDVVRKRERPEPVSAAIVLNKADLLRFEPPVDRWLRSPDDTSGRRPIDPVEFLRESADVYAFLSARNALALAEAYEACDKATLHVASPTGGVETSKGIYERGVTPRRVLRPLVAMLAMTGVLTGPDAEKVGV